MIQKIYYLIVYILTRFGLIPLFLLVLLNNLILSKISQSFFSLTNLSFIIIFNLLQFWFLRVLDEYSDLEFDKKNNSKRLVASDKVSLKSLTYSSVLFFCVINILWLDKFYFTLIFSILLLSFYLFLKQIKDLQKRLGFVKFNLISMTNSWIILFSSCYFWLSSYSFSNLNWKAIILYILIPIIGTLMLELIRKIERKTKDNYLEYFSKKNFWKLIFSLQLIMSLSILKDTWFFIFIILIIFSNIFIYPLLQNKNKFGVIKLSNYLFYLFILLIFYIYL
jgi:4-hydroxybenzoate polyprenyltransferase